MTALKRTRHSGYALILVLMSIAVAFVVGVTFLYTSATTSSVARTINNYAQARQVAESGLSAVVYYAEHTSDWRTAQEPGPWLTATPIANGNVDVDVEYTSSPTISPVGVDDASFETETGTLETPVFDPQMSGSVGGWELTREALVEAGATVPSVGVVASPDSVDGNNHLEVFFGVNVNGAATATQTLSSTLEPHTTYALHVDVGRQLLSHTLADLSVQVLVDGTEIVSSKDPSLFTSYNESGDPSIFESFTLNPAQVRQTLRFTTDQTPPSGPIRIQLRAESVLGVVSSATFDHIQFDRESYSDIVFHVVGRYGVASQRMTVTARQQGPLADVRVVGWSEP